jgi:ketosteroid isomerase-like protein
MSREDVERVRRVYEVDGPFWLPLGPDEERALLDRLFGGDLYDEQFEVLMPPDYPEGAQVYVGRSGMERLIAMLRDSWTAWRFEAERFVDAGDSVVVLVRVVAEGGHSGLAAVQETAHVWTVRDGRLTSIRIYRDRAQALDATGVSDLSPGGGGA